ncbi:CP2 [Symbiodinium sp. CCMP2592]|nr:CP2 [Symbiodinium sp. CCMP2592]
MALQSAHSSEEQLVTAIANDDVEEMLTVSCDQSVTKSIGSMLHVAAMYSSVACVKHLVTDMADVNLRNKDGYSPIHFASADGDAEVIRSLLAARADLNLTTPDARARLMRGALALDASGGRNPLHLAAEKGRLAAAEVLFAACPALADAKDFDGALPRDVALREGAFAAKLAPNRKAIAELLNPAEEIPELACLREQADVDAKKRRHRLDKQEAIAKAAKARLTSRPPSDYGYQAKWPDIYKMQVRDVIPCLNHELLAALSLKSEQRHSILRNLCEEIAEGVFAFQMVPEADVMSLSTKLLEEIDGVEEWAKQSDWELRRPNSMNRYGVVLEDLGLGAFAAALATGLASPLAAALYPERRFGVFNDIHAFTVRYRGGEDRFLETHVDSSEVTLNICLGGDFRGGGVYFHGLDTQEGPSDPMTSPHPSDCTRCAVTHEHRVGTAIIHLGNHIHGAHSIEDGSRTNLILWCRSSPAKNGSEPPELD